MLLHRSFYTLLYSFTLAICSPFGSFPVRSLVSETKQCNVLDYGGIFGILETEADLAPAIQRAFDDCVHPGGATLLIPAGHYSLRSKVLLTGASNWALQIDGSIRLDAENTSWPEFSYITIRRSSGVEISSSRGKGKFYNQTDSDRGSHKKGTDRTADGADDGRGLGFMTGPSILRLVHVRDVVIRDLVLPYSSLRTSLQLHQVSIVRIRNITYRGLLTARTEKLDLHVVDGCDLESDDRDCFKSDMDNGSRLNPNAPVIDFPLSKSWSSPTPVTSSLERYGSDQRSSLILFADAVASIPPAHATRSSDSPDRMFDGFTVSDSQSKLSPDTNSHTASPATGTFWSIMTTTTCTTSIPLSLAFETNPQNLPTVALLSMNHPVSSSDPKFSATSSWTSIGLSPVPESVVPTSLVVESSFPMLSASDGTPIGTETEAEMVETSPIALATTTTSETCASRPTVTVTVTVMPGSDGGHATHAPHVDTSVSLGIYQTTTITTRLTICPPGASARAQLELR